MVIFYSFNLRIKTEYRQWAKLRGKLYKAGRLAIILENPFDVIDGESWGHFKFVGACAGYYEPLERPVKKSRAIRVEYKEHLAVAWMYAEPFRTYKQAAAKFRVGRTALMRAAKKFREGCTNKVDPVQDVVDQLMADYLRKPLHYSLGELSDRYGLSAHTISKRIRETYAERQWPSCLQFRRRIRS
jgi:hypothetical protein